MSSSQKQPTIADYLGLELMSELVSYMDMYSISAFLQAFPFLKRHTVLLTDHETEAFQFFRVDNVDVARLDHSSLESGTLSWVFEGSRRNRVYAIQLIELTDIRLFGRLYRNLTNTNKTDNCWKPILSSNTFLFIQHGQEVSAPLFRQQFAASDLLSLHRLCKWHIGAPLNSSVDQVWSSVEQFDQYRVKPAEDDKALDSGTLSAVVQPTGLAQLRSLRIEKISEITGLYLPTVKELFIDFTDPGLSGEPLIDKVEARLVKKLVIHYRGTPPLITPRNAIGSYINGGHMHLIPMSERHAYLEITDVLSLQFTTATTRTKPTPRATELLSERSICPIRYCWGPFRQRFDIIVLTGVPGSITTKSSFARCRSLTWTIVDEFDYEDERNRTYGGVHDLEEVTLRVCAPGMSTPYNLASICGRLHRVNVMLTDIDQSICPGLLWRAPRPYQSRNRPKYVQLDMLLERAFRFTHFYLTFTPFQKTPAKRMIKHLSESEFEGITRRLGLFTQLIAVWGFNKELADFWEDGAEIEMVPVGD